MDHEKTIKKILETTGIEINGEKPWDIQVHNPRFYRKALAETDIGLGNSYMDKWWDCKRLDLFFEKIISARLEETVKNKKRIILGVISSKIMNLQSKSLSKKVGEVHYDVGNKLYEIMLGKTMSYTCAYWKNLKRIPQNLDKAQEQKLNLVCKKLKLKPGMKTGYRLCSLVKKSCSTKRKMPSMPTQRERTFWHTGMARWSAEFQR